MTERIFSCSDFNWNGIENIDYKPSGGERPETFKNVTRQNIFKGGNEASFDMRYFECASGGYTTLEKHEHVHVVVILRGQASVIVGSEVFSVKPFDMIRIPSWNTHQLINTGDEPFGFLCTVNSTRDSFQLLSREEVKALQENEETSGIIRIPEEYFGKRDSRNKKGGIQ